MSWQLWIVVGWLTLSAIVTIATVGKPKQPTTGGVAAFSTVIMAVLIWLIIWAGTGARP